MKSYEIKTSVNTFLWVEIEAENEEKALEIAGALSWDKWKQDTDFSSCSEMEAQELEEGSHK